MDDIGDAMISANVVVIGVQRDTEWEVQLGARGLAAIAAEAGRARAGDRRDDPRRGIDATDSNEK